MVQSERTRTRRTPSSVFAVLAVVGAALVGVLGYQSLTISSSTAAPIAAPRSDLRGLPGDGDGVVPAGPRSTSSPTAAASIGSPRSRLRGLPGEADGVVPAGTTVFDDEYPAIANLEPALLRALRAAATDAAHDGIELFVDSGWRSPKYQEQLFREAISKYGSAEEAVRWVATADTSPHVSGEAVDVGPSDATTWLSSHGARYGLCQIYRNEPWHYELRPEAVAQGCSPMYADPTRDPRMQR